MFNDPAKQNGSDKSCGHTCTRHALKITSHVDQTVWIGTHTWQYYGYGNSEWCPNPSDELLNQLQGDSNDYSLFTFLETSELKHIVFNKHTREKMTWEQGSNWLPKLFLSAGQTIEIEVELNWDRTGITKDWSVTAWGEKGGVSVNHQDGITSDSLPYVPKDSYSWKSSRVGTTSPVKKVEKKTQPKKDFWSGGYDFGIDLSAILSNTYGDEKEE